MTQITRSSSSHRQIYWHTCLNVNGGQRVTLMGPHSIVRAVTQNPDGTWRFEITKTGASATINPLPQPDATFFEHINFGGASFTSSGDMGSLGSWWNDRMSSITIPSGRTVIIYEHANFGGASRTLRGNQADLRQYSGPGPGGTWNDVVSSIRVQ